MIHTTMIHTSQVRRKADPAKENVREFMAKWKDNNKVDWHPSHDEFVGESLLDVSKLPSYLFSVL